MDVKEIFAYIGGIITLGGLLVVVISGLRRQNSQEKDNVITIQQNEIKAYKDSNERLTEENASLKTENTTLKKGNRDLKNIAQQTPQITQLISDVAAVAKSVADIAVKLGIGNDSKK